MVRNIYFIAFNRYLIRKNTTNYSKSQQKRKRDTFCILTVILSRINHTCIATHIKEPVEHNLKSGSMAQM